MVKLPVDPRKVAGVPKPVVSKLARGRDTAFGRFPILFTLLTTFGAVATFYGFEGVIDKLDFFADRPVIILASGILTLLLTGALYKKL